MANEENLIPFFERSKSEARENGRKGGKASGKARRKKRDMRKALETLMDLDVPDKKFRKQLESLGLEPSVEQGLAFSVVMTAISKGDYRALETINRIMGQDAESQARIDRLNAETERIKEETDRKSGKTGQDIAAAQTKAIADMISSPATERVLQDFLGGGNNDDGDADADAATDPVQPAEQEAD